MSQTLVKLSFLLLLLIPLNTAQAQIKKGDLQKGVLTSSEITASEKHHYKINLQEDQFVFLRLMQKGVDLKINTFDSEGEKIEEFDSPNGRNGYELFTLISNKKGTYLVEISALDEKEPTGKYDLTVKIIKPKATTPMAKLMKFLLLGIILKLQELQLLSFKMAKLYIKMVMDKPI